MTVKDTKRELRELFTVLNPQINYTFAEVVEAVNKLNIDPEHRKYICAAYIGFAIGREYGFEVGKNFIFDYTPEYD